MSSIPGLKWQFPSTSHRFHPVYRKHWRHLHWCHRRKATNFMRSRPFCAERH